MQLRMLVAFAACLAGCATAPDEEASNTHRDPVYRTGSNIPLRDGNIPSSVLTVKPDDMMPRTNMPDPRPRPIIP